MTSNSVAHYNSKRLQYSPKTNYKPKFKRRWFQNEQNYQMLLLENTQMYILSVYRSQQATPLTVMIKIQELLGKVDQKKLFIIGGDFNLCPIEQEKNVITKALEHFGFTQMIKEATHENGRALDHLYIRNIKNPISISIQSLYWTDHDAITVMVPGE